MAKSTYEKIDGVVSLASNSITAKTGYGVQANQLVNRMLRHGMKVASLSNYGLEGRIDEIRTPYGKLKHYPRGFKPYSDDVMAQWHNHHRAAYPGKKHALMTLFDVWIYNDAPGIDEIPIISWVPLDHLNLPPSVAQFLLRPNVTPVAMSPFGLRQLTDNGIDATYIPHAVDRSVFKRTPNIDGVEARKFLGIGADDFLVTFVGANKADGSVHRKALDSNLMAFSVFSRSHPNAYLYLHTETSNAFNGFYIPRLLKAVGLDSSRVIIPDVEQMRIGFPDEYMAGIYSASDVLLGASMGEGFQVPLIEASACGLRQIASNWTAPPDLVSPDSWLVDGQPWWHEAHTAWWHVPSISSIVDALQLAYDAPRGPSEIALEWSKQFDVEVVWRDRWMPFLQEYFAN
jgi:glycosyltransferase involved in cell wall biosynthesis